jgi:hypothetical protein
MGENFRTVRAGRFTDCREPRARDARGRGPRTGVMRHHLAHEIAQVLR